MTWYPIECAPRNGELVIVYAPGVQDLPEIVCLARYHPDGGWCIDELRYPTHWFPFDPPKED